MTPRKPCGTRAAYVRHLRHGEKPCAQCTEANRDAQRTGNDRGLCTVADCARGPVARGYCSLHYKRWRKHGDPTVALPSDHHVPAVEARFWRDVSSIDTRANCWTWTGTRNPDGYGRISIKGRLVPAHRYSYELLVGPISGGLQIDHLCGNHGCVNPAHLEPVTQAENVRRAQRIGHHPNAPKVCRNGHDWTVVRPYVWTLADGTEARRCRACVLEYGVRRRRAQRGAK